LIFKTAKEPGEKHRLEPYFGEKKNFMNQFFIRNKFYIFAIIFIIISFFVAFWLLSYMTDLPSKTARIVQQKANLNHFGSTVLILPLFSLATAYFGFRAKESKFLAITILLLVVLYYSTFIFI